MLRTLKNKISQKHMLAWGVFYAMELFPGITANLSLWQMYVLENIYQDCFLTRQKAFKFGGKKRRKKNGVNK